MNSKCKSVLCLLLVIIVCSCTEVRGQKSTPTDSLLKALRTTRNDTVRSLIFASLAENYLQRNQFDSTIRAARAGTDASEKAGSYAAMARNLIAMSAAYMSLRQNDPAATPSLKATVMAKKAGDPELQTDAWINRGRYFRAAAQNQYALKALENQAAEP